MANNNILVALREKRTNKLINVAYSEQGLKYTYNTAGRCLFDLDKCKVVPYEFIAHNKDYLIKAEKKWAYKARRLKTY